MSRQRRADEPGDELAVRLTLETGHRLLHDAPHVLLRGGTRLCDNRLDDRRDLLLPRTPSSSLPSLPCADAHGWKATSLDNARKFRMKFTVADPFALPSQLFFKYTIDIQQ